MLKRKTRTSEGWPKVVSSLSHEERPLEDDARIPDEEKRLRSEARSSLRKERSSGGLVLKIKRGSAKLLLRLGLWSSGTSDNLSTAPSSPKDVGSSRSVNNVNRGPANLEITNEPLYSNKSSYSLPAKPEYDLSQKLSIFTPPTVIRRTRTRAGLGFGPIEGSCPVVKHEDWSGQLRGSTDHSTDYSPVFSQTECRSSLDGISTSLTLLSQGHEKFAQRLRTSSSKSAPSMHSVTQPFVKPSIVTVETAAAAKVFFETHFNSISLIQDGRNHRLRELQEHFCATQIANEERLTVHKAWIAQESEYLRQSRLLKTKSNRLHIADTVSTAGYEPIRVLGQGSFGIVQLVREKRSDQSLLSRKEGRPDIMPEVQKDSKYGRLFTRRPIFPAAGDASQKSVQKGKQENVYAMKVIRKAEMVHLCQEGHIRAEREFLTASERSKWIVPLIASFQDSDHLYLVMEYETGGDFFGLLLKHGVLSEKDTMWYVAEMILCIEEAHRLGWIHRDVKPENFLISSSGHLKLADFGLAFDGHWSHNQAYFHNHRYSLISKLGVDVRGDAVDQSGFSKIEQSDISLLEQNRDYASKWQLDRPLLSCGKNSERRRFARSIVGTSQYMAPEIVAGEPYDGRCDYWSIGIILYECLYGVTPFYRDDRDDTKRCILNHRKSLGFPRERLSDIMVSPYAINLIQQLLQKQEFRLSSRDYRINDCALWHGLLNTVYTNVPDSRNCHWNGSHVYRDDASDIKSHLFFRSIHWREMLHRHPPYVPPDKSWEDRICPGNEEQPDLLELGNTQNTPQKFEDASMLKYDSPLMVECRRLAGEKSLKIDVDEHDKPKKRRNKEKRRARDKILRDAVVGPTALDIRTKGAFVGYTWRRPKSVRDVLQIERGRNVRGDCF